MTNLTIVRPHISSYLSRDFRTREDDFCQKLNCNYSDKLPEVGDFVLVTDTHVRLETLEPEQLHRLRLVIHPNSGFDNLNLELMKSYSIPVVIGNPIRANAVAEYTLNCLFNHFNTPRFQNKWSQSRVWERPLLKELNILLIGHGHIGSIINRSLSALGCELLIHDPNAKFLIESGQQIHIDHYDLSKVDAIILCASLDKEEQAIIDNDFLNRLHDRVLIINPARGKLIDTNALFDFLKLNPNAFAFLDVLSEEPPTDKVIALIEELKNLSLSSHIAGVYKNISEAMLDFEKLVLTDYQKLSLEDFLRKYETLTV